MDLRAEIAAQNEKLMHAINSRDAGAAAALYTEDARALPTNSDVISGRAAIREFWQAGIDGGIKDVKLESVTVDAPGDGTAYEVGRYELTVDSGEAAIHDVGKYVVIWKRLESGWHLHVDIWNTSQPAPE